MGTYSFKDVQAALVGVGGSINLGDGSGSAAEGITIEAVEDKNTMMMGADGDGMHSLNASEASVVTARFLKTSETNAKLSLMYNLQTQSSVTHGKNVMTIRDVARGDTTVLAKVAFKKRPSITYSKEGDIVEWTFDAVRTIQQLGSGNPAV